MLVLADGVAVVTSGGCRGRLGTCVVTGDNSDYRLRAVPATAEETCTIYVAAAGAFILYDPSLLHVRPQLLTPIQDQVFHSLILTYT